MAGLEALAGTFVGTDEIHPSKWSAGGTARVDIDSEWQIGQSVLVQRWQDALPAGVFETLNVFTTDGSTGEVLLYSYDTLGYPPHPPARGSWEGERLTLDRASARGESRVEFIPTCEGFRWSKFFRSVETEPWQLVVDGTMRRHHGHR